MKIVAIDASRGNLALNRTLLATGAAAEEAGAEVTYLRLSDYRIMTCLSCRLCAMGEGCKMRDDLPELLDLIAESSGIIISAPDDKSSCTKSLNTLLARLRTSFRDNSNHQPQLPGFGHPNNYLSKVARDTKRAIIITGSVNEGSLGAYFAPNVLHGAQVRRIRRSLEACNINAVGSMAIKRANLRNDDLCIESKTRARSMGRLIAGKL